MTVHARRQQLEAVFKEQYGRLYTLAFRMTGTKETAQDAQQTAFLNAYASLDRFREESALLTRLFRIAVNAAKRLGQEERKLPVVAYAEAHGISEDEVFAHVRGFGNAEDEAIIRQTRESRDWGQTPVSSRFRPGFVPGFTVLDV